MLRSLAILLGCTACFAQPRDAARDAVEWSVSLRGVMAQMANPVVRVHGTAGLARVTCRVDPAAASGLYRDAIASLFNLPDGAFGERATTALPVASFSGLWKYVIPAALKCDPNLASIAENPRTRERMAAERNAANATLHRAYELIGPDMPLDKQSMLDRAAQLGRAAAEAGDPETLDMSLLRQLLSTLNARAPDLADELFAQSLELALSGRAPLPDDLQTLARFLFTAPDQVSVAEADQRSRRFNISGALVENLMATRPSANPDNIQALIEAALKLLTNADAVDRSPVVAYALAYQLLPRARDLMPDRAADLESAVDQLAAGIGGAAAQVQAKLGPLENPDQESGDPARRNSWLISQIRSALSGGQIERAYDLLPGVNDLPIRGQLKSLIAFFEAARAIEKGNEQGVTMANQLRPGVKRSLLYIAAIANTRRLDLALQLLPLASKDIAPLPAEQRVRLLSALAAALLRTDVDSSLSVLNQLVAASNDVRVNPRRGKFDPASVRRTFNSNAGDSALVMAGNRGFYEAVQRERGRHNFVLHVPGAEAFTITAFLSTAAGVDPDRLAAAIKGLTDENTQAASWVALADLRLRVARALP